MYLGTTTVPSKACHKIFTFYFYSPCNEHITVPDRVRHSDFLKSIFKLSISCFGGPQAHLVHYQNVLVERGKYLSKEDLFEIYALCQIVPGPTSTQILISIGHRIGGARLAYLTLLFWALPSVLMLILAALLVIHFQMRELSAGLTRFIQPMAVGFVGYAAYTMSMSTVRSYAAVAIMVVSGIVAYFVTTPVAFPVILLLAGLTTALNYRRHPREIKKQFTVSWANFFLWVGVLVGAAVLGAVTKALPIRLFENFYRNGSMIFGGGQVLAPLLYNEFVQYPPKQYLTAQEFLVGYGLVQAVPGPLFSFSAYVGTLSMRGAGVSSELIGGLMATAGIFLPGTFLIFFTNRIWDSLKRFRPVKASLEGVNAASAGLVVATAILLFQPLENSPLNMGIIAATFCLLAFSRMPSWMIIGIGLLMGLLLPLP